MRMSPVLFYWKKVLALGANAVEPVKSTFPVTVDLNIIGRCNLNCAWCWGPPHEAKEPVTLTQWQNLLTALRQNGTRNLVLSGGEPLLKKWLDELAKHAKKELGMRVTLSTNGILLRQKASSVLPYIDDLGIPLDGHTPEINQVMRIGKYKHFDYALDAILFAQSQYPSIDLTLRTVVAAQNMESVPLIGQMLLSRGVNPERLRWKLYQVNPIGPRVEDIKKGGWLISGEEFNNVVFKTRTLNSRFNIIPQANSISVGRYFIIFPDGKAHVIKEGLEDFTLGNIIEEQEKVFSCLKETSYLSKNDGHGSEGQQNSFENPSKLGQTEEPAAPVPVYLPHLSYST